MSSLPKFFYLSVVNIILLQTSKNITIYFVFIFKIRHIFQCKAVFPFAGMILFSFHMDHYLFYLQMHISLINVEYSFPVTTLSTGDIE